jgi:hypothetical protein
LVDEFPHGHTDAITACVSNVELDFFDSSDGLRNAVIRFLQLG